MNIDDLLRAGNDILEDVMEAVNENNYSDLGQKIRSRVRDVTSSSSGGAYSGQTGRQPGGTARGRNAAGAGYGQRPGNAGYGQQPQNTGYGQRPQKNGFGQQSQNIGYGQQRTAAGYGSYAGRRSNFLLKRCEILLLALYFQEFCTFYHLKRGAEELLLLRTLLTL